MDTKSNQGVAITSMNDMTAANQQAIQSVAEMNFRNMEMMVSVAQLANQSITTTVEELMTFTQRSFERAAAAAKAMTGAKSPADLARLQMEFAQQQFEASRVEMMKFSDKTFQVAREQIATQKAHILSNTTADLKAKI